MFSPSVFFFLSYCVTIVFDHILFKKVFWFHLSLTCKCLLYNSKRCRRTLCVFILKGVTPLLTLLWQTQLVTVASMKNTNTATSTAKVSVSPNYPNAWCRERLIGRNLVLGMSRINPKVLTSPVIVPLKWKGRLSYLTRFPTNLFDSLYISNR